MAMLLWLSCLLAAGAFPLPAQGAARTAAPAGIPREAFQVLAHVRATGQPLPGYEGGRRFGNYGGDGEQKLPATDARGGRISYQEWDIHPHVRGHNRGPERLVTGSDHRAWFTGDHYRSFTEMP
jgi:guanyl-specific ribonuclease Sa